MLSALLICLQPFQRVTILLSRASLGLALRTVHALENILVQVCTIVGLSLTFETFDPQPSANCYPKTIRLYAAHFSFSYGGVWKWKPIAGTTRATLIVHIGALEMYNHSWKCITSGGGVAIAGQHEKPQNSHEQALSAARLSLLCPPGE